MKLWLQFVTSFISKANILVGPLKLIETIISTLIETVTSTLIETRLISIVSKPIEL